MKWVHDQNWTMEGSISKMLSNELVWKELNNISTKNGVKI